MPRDLSSAQQQVRLRDSDELMRRIAAGDEAAAKQMVRQHLPLLISLAVKMLGNKQEAEEIAQDAFLKLWKQAAHWQPGRALASTWLRRVASNACIDRLRARRSRALLEGEEQSVGARQQLDLEEKELQDAVKAALEKLPERQKLALGLCYFEGLGQREAADLMEVSEHALESLLARARRGLKAELSSRWEQLLPDHGEVDRFATSDISGGVKK
ncbi:MAG: sigma-70 family RNA polymerase sigma factor [Hyphomicrobiaceae bacterium]|nr:sigma-70 family RNA polymerase sigma factor [Hyphomicrobiaceae bacterium]